MKIMTIVGTRPELIRLSRTIDLLDRTTQHVLVHTGQNYDYELNQVFFDELEIRQPDYFLNADRSSFASTIGDIFIKIEPILLQVKPDAVLILGDTNSSMAGYIAKRFHIPLYHMEAGNRSFDQNVPEEINRKVIDHLADFNMVYTEHARRNLIYEGFPQRRIFLTGSPMKEVLKYFQSGIDKSRILETLQIEPSKYFLFSFHREENVDNDLKLKRILCLLEDINQTYGYPIIVSTHPRTRQRLGGVVNLEEKSGIHFLKPFGFFDYIMLQKSAYCTLSDSGTISEEAAILGFPAITIRESMERPEALDNGSIVMTGLDPEVVRSSIELVRSKLYTGIPAEYAIDDTSVRVVSQILSTAKLSNKWWGIEKPIMSEK